MEENRTTDTMRQRAAPRHRKRASDQGRPLSLPQPLKASLHLLIPPSPGPLSQGQAKGQWEYKVEYAFFSFSPS